MKIVFLSNYFNHHQKPFSDAMYKRLGGDYLFIETSEMKEFRKKLGYGMDSLPDYVIPAAITNASFEKIKKIINDADVLITGAAPEKYIEERKKQKKLIFRYSEKVLKNGKEPLKYIPRFIKYHWINRFKKIYLLSAGEFAAKDYRSFALFRKKAFKWGYFPAIKEYEDIDALISQKEKNSILWAGRFLTWKHPEACVEVAKRLKQDGYEFSIDMIGTVKNPDGFMALVCRNGVQDNVRTLGAMPPDKVREHMEKSEIYLFTSGEKEGWGAVLNEAMGSACAVVASDAAGATSYLIDNGQNGFSYKSGDVDELYEKVKQLLDNESVRKSMSKNAYETMKAKWNAEEAAERLLTVVDAIMNKTSKDIYKDGPCSRA